MFLRICLAQQRARERQREAGAGAAVARFCCLDCILPGAGTGMSASAKRRGCVGAQAFLLGRAAVSDPSSPHSAWIPRSAGCSFVRRRRRCGRSPRPLLRPQSCGAPGLVLLPSGAGCGRGFVLGVVVVVGGPRPRSLRGARQRRGATILQGHRATCRARRAARRQRRHWPRR